jgi:hypothetical protein
MEAATATPIAAPPRPSHKEPAAGTEYVILERVQAADGGEAWRVVDTVTHGGGSDAAIRKSRDGKKGGFKAIPHRNFKGGLDLDRETREVTVSRPISD